MKLFRFTRCERVDDEHHHRPAAVTFVLQIGTEVMTGILKRATERRETRSDVTPRVALSPLTCTATNSSYAVPRPTKP